MCQVRHQKVDRSYTIRVLESKHHRFSTNFVVNFYNNFSFRIHLTTGNLVLVSYHNSSISVFHITPKEIILTFNSSFLK